MSKESGVICHRFTTFIYQGVDHCTAICYGVTDCDSDENHLKIQYEHLHTVVESLELISICQTKKYPFAFWSFTLAHYHETLLLQSEQNGLLYQEYEK